MPGKLHEEIVQKVREAYLEMLNSYNPKKELFIGGMDIMAYALIGYGSDKDRSQSPDFLVNFFDKFGPIIIEVGKMKDGKWREVVCPDGKSIRVLRVWFDGLLAMIRPRYTKKEMTFMKVLENVLSRWMEKEKVIDVENAAKHSHLELRIQPKRRKHGKQSN